MNNFILPECLIHCNNFLCVNHNEVIWQKIDELLDILVSSAEHTIPIKSISNNNNDNKGIIPGWNDHVKPFREKSIFWHNTWKNAGRPRNGPIADARRFARTKYHWALKQVKKEKDKIILEKNANNLATKSFQQFWRTIKNINGNDNRISSIIDGKINESEIANHFGDIYANLYNSVEDVQLEDQVRQVHNLVKNRCNSNKCISHNCHNVSSHIVKKAINSLSSGKNYETYNMFSDHFKNATDLVIKALSQLVTAMIKHGSTNNLVNKAVIKPIPKNKQKSLSDSKNYRAICKNSILSKILD